MNPSQLRMIVVVADHSTFTRATLEASLSSTEPRAEFDGARLVAWLTFEGHGQLLRRRGFRQPP